VRFFQDLPPCLIGLEAYATAHHWRVNSPSWPMRCG
jgi:hypothetical protein